METSGFCCLCLFVVSISSFFFCLDLSKRVCGGVVGDLIELIERCSLMHLNCGVLMMNHLVKRI